MPTRPGSLDGESVTLERNGTVLARGTLRDTRQQQYIEIPTQGGNVTRKPGRITGDVIVDIDEVNDPELTEEMEMRAGQQRISQLNQFDIVLDDGQSIADCSLSGCWGGRSFSLNGV